MPTTVTSQIGTGPGATYSTIQSWEDDCPADLTSADQIWRGECQNENFTAGVDITGIVTDSTRYVELTTVAGASFMDHVDARTNPQRINSSVGACITTTAGNGTLSIRAAYVRVSKLQMNSSGYAAALYTNSSGQNFRVENCILRSPADSVGYYETSSGTHYIINCLFIHDNLSTNKSANMFRNAGTFNVYNCTTIRPSNRSASGTAYWCDWVTLNIRNCAAFGFGAFNNGWTSGTSGYNASDVTIAFGSNNQSGLTYADQFEETSSASGLEDYRLKSGATLIDNGEDLSAFGVTTDIVGYSRSGTFDIGSWEYASSTPPPSRRRFYVIG